MLRLWEEFWDNARVKCYECFKSLINLSRRQSNVGGNLRREEFWDKARGKAAQGFLPPHSLFIFRLILKRQPQAYVLGRTDE